MLRMASLALQLSMLATNICGQKNNSCRQPLLVRLAKGDIPRRVSLKLVDLLGLLHLDPFLNEYLPSVVVHLCITACHIATRFDQYTSWPIRSCLMSEVANPADYYNEIIGFLRAEPDTLDPYYSRPLYNAAWQSEDGSEMSAIRFMLQKNVQNELSVLAKSIEGSTLDVERTDD